MRTSYTKQMQQRLVDRHATPGNPWPQPPRRSRPRLSAEGSGSRERTRSTGRTVTVTFWDQRLDVAASWLLAATSVHGPYPGLTTYSSCAIHCNVPAGSVLSAQEPPSGGFCFLGAIALRYARTEH